MQVGTLATRLWWPHSIPKVVGIQLAGFMGAMVEMKCSSRLTLLEREAMEIRVHKLAFLELLISMRSAQWSQQALAKVNEVQFDHNFAVGPTTCGVP